MPQQQAAVQPTAAKPVHKHTNPDTVYQNTCPACRAADRERSKLDVRSVPESDLVRTTFLIPESDYDNAVCRAYIAHKYPEAQYVHSQLNIKRVANWPDGEQIVVVRRDTWPKAPAPNKRKVKNDEDKWEYEDQPPENFLSEVVESAPLDVRELVVTKMGDRFTKAQTDVMPLIRRLAELMPVPYRIDLPRHEDDELARFVHA